MGRKKGKNGKSKQRTQKFSVYKLFARITNVAKLNSFNLCAVCVFRERYSILNVCKRKVDINLDDILNDRIYYLSFSLYIHLQNKLIKFCVGIGLVHFNFTNYESSHFAGSSFIFLVAFLFHFE